MCGVTEQVRLHEGTDAPVIEAAVVQTPGMDVSSHQGAVNWSTAWANGARFAYVKATEGTTYQNPDFAQQYTDNQAKYATTPAALAGFERLQQLNEAGDLNKDYALDVAVGTGSAIQLYTNACPTGDIPSHANSQPRF